MTAQTRATLKTYFLTSLKPTQTQFANQIDSFLSLIDTGAQSIISDVSALGTVDFRKDITVSGRVTTGALTTGTFSISGVLSAAALNVAGAAQFTANISANTLNVAGATTLTNTLTISNSAATTTNGNVTIGGTLAVSAAATFSQNISVTASAATESIRISRTTADSLLVGSATGDGNLIYATSNGSVLAAMSLNNSDATVTSYPIIYFRRGAGNPGAVVGSVTTTNAATAYNTSSDKRLKENFVPLNGTGEIIDQISVGKFDWKYHKGSSGVGVLAQDAIAIVPEAVTMGDDDAPDNNGNVKQQWGVDYSKFVPYLIGEIQSLRKRIQQLEGK